MEEGGRLFGDEAELTSAELSNDELTGLFHPTLTSTALSGCDFSLFSKGGLRWATVAARRPKLSGVRAV